MDLNISNRFLTSVIILAISSGRHPPFVSAPPTQKAPASSAVLRIFKIYSGLGGGFGGADFQGEYEFPNEDKANEYAYECACMDYEGYDGMHGLDSCDTIQEENPDWSEEEVMDAWREQRESWLEYWAEPVDKPEPKWVTSK